MWGLRVQLDRGLHRNEGAPGLLLSFGGGCRRLCSGLRRVSGLRWEFVPLRWQLELWRRVLALAVHPSALAPDTAAREARPLLGAMEPLQCPTGARGKARNFLPVWQALFSSQGRAGACTCCAAERSGAEGAAVLTHWEGAQECARDRGRHAARGQVSRAWGSSRCASAKFSCPRQGRVAGGADGEAVQRGAGSSEALGCQRRGVNAPALQSQSLSPGTVVCARPLLDLPWSLEDSWSGHCLRAEVVVCEPAWPPAP